MKRRDVLTTAAAVAFAGCLGGSGGDGNGATTDSTSRATDESATTDTETRVGTTAEPTTDAETDTPRTVETRTETTTETTADETATGPTDTPIPVPDRLTTPRKGALPANEARVTFEDGGSRVVVTGTIIGKNGCQTAVLDSVRKTNAGLVITVATERDAPADALCSQALVGIDYRFVVRVETPPKSVTVVHRGATGRRTITTVKPDG